MPLEVWEQEKQGLAPADTAHAEAFVTEIDLYELLLRLLEKLHYIILVALLGSLLAGVYSFWLVAPKYSSTAKIYVLSSSDSALNLSDLQIGTYLTSDYKEIFKIWEVHEKVITALDLPYTYAQLEKMLSIGNPANSRMLTIDVTSTSPTEAAAIANMYAQVACDYIAEKMATDRPNLMSVALPNNIPVSPNKTMNLLLGMFLGAVIAIGIITVHFMMDDRIKSADDIIKYTGMAVLAAVPLLNDENLGRMQKMSTAAKKKTGRKRK